MLEVRDRKCSAHYGEDAWAQAKPQVVPPTSLIIVHGYLIATAFPLIIKGKSLLWFSLWEPHQKFARCAVQQVLWQVDSKRTRRSTSGGKAGNRPEPHPSLYPMLRMPLWLYTLQYSWPNLDSGDLLHLHMLMIATWACVEARDYGNPGWVEDTVTNTSIQRFLLFWCVCSLFLIDGSWN